MTRHHAVVAKPQPPYIVAPLPRCAIVLDRHTHKNGGSTMRQVMNLNDLHDGWAFWGYGLHQHGNVVHNLMHTLLGPRNRSCAAWWERAPVRLLIEHHYSRHSLEAIMGHFGPLSPLQRIAARCRCRIVLLTRLRRPTSFYISFYRWTVNWRQQRNKTAFGRDFFEWLPRNLQAAMLLNPIDATWAEFTGVHTADGRSRRKIYSQFDEPGTLLPGALPGDAPPAGMGAKRRAELRRVIDSFDLVGLVERFDETLLLLSDLTGLQRLLYTRTVPTSTNPHYRQPPVSEVCEDYAYCDQRVRAVAPLDHELYEEALASFNKRVATLGAPFQERLRLFRETNRKHQIKRMANRTDLLRFEDTPRVMERSVSAPTEMHHRVPMGRLNCFLGDGPRGVETCQRVYADTPFRYNWRHTYSSCCERLTYCTHRRLHHRRIPNNCFKWLPMVADPGDDVAKAKRDPLINASLSSGRLCQDECSQPAEPEAGLSPKPFRVASVAERATLPQPLLFTRARQRLHASTSGRMAACNDTPVELIVGKPWLDFESCEAEGETRENLFSHSGACARELWMRLNCRKTCGTCGLGLREAIALKPGVALKAARAAAIARNSAAFEKFSEHETKRKARQRAQRAAKRAESLKAKAR